MSPIKITIKSHGIYTDDELCRLQAVKDANDLADKANIEYRFGFADIEHKNIDDIEKC